MSISEALGAEHEIKLGAATIRYRDVGSGPPLVFVHGLLANGDLWRHVAPAIASHGYRCIVPDWPLGSHTLAVPEIELTPATVAHMVVDFVEQLALSDVTVIANDTGGALTQLAMVDHPERLNRVVLISCDSFDRFLPPPFHLLPRLVSLPGAAWLTGRLLATRPFQRSPMGFRWIAKHPVPQEIMDSYVRPIGTNPEVRQDFRRFTRAIDNRYTLDAAPRLAGFTSPVQLIWDSEGRLFPVELAERLHRILPNSELHTIDDCYVFIPEDQPTELTAMILDFLRRTDINAEL